MEKRILIQSQTENFVAKYYKIVRHLWGFKGDRQTPVYLATCLKQLWQFCKKGIRKGLEHVDMMGLD